MSQRRGRFLAIGAVGAAVFLGALDQTVVVTALPAIVDDLQVPFNRLNDAAWIVTAYLLGYTVALPLVGRISDVHGRQRTLIGCLVLLALTSVWCGAARTLESLITARGLQAVSGGALLPVALGIVGTSISERSRILALGVVAATAEAGGVLGPAWGALILDHATWPWVFWLNVPIAVALLAVLLIAGPPRWPIAERGANVDYIGGLLLGAGLGALALGLSRETSQGVGTRLSLGTLGAVLLVAFVAWQRRVRDPLVDMQLFLQRAFSAANVLSLLSGVALIVALVDVPLYSATVLQRSAVEGGLLLMRLMAAIPIGAVVGGLATRRLGAMLTALAGAALSGLGLVLLSRWRPETAELDLTTALAVAGLGFGLQLAPISAVVVARAGPSRAGGAAALATVMRMIGMLIGLSSLTSWGLERFDDLVSGLTLPFPAPGESAAESTQRLADYQHAILDAGLIVFNEIFLIAGLICVLACIPALFMRLPARAVR